MSSIESCISNLPGIKSVKVALLAERGIVEYDPDWVGSDGTGWDDEKIVEEISDVGFDAVALPHSSVTLQNVRLVSLNGRRSSSGRTHLARFRPRSKFMDSISQQIPPSSQAPFSKSPVS